NVLIDDVQDQEIRETITVRNFKVLDISDISDPVMKMATHLVSKLNGQRWTQ
ncbi:hypothetical protein KI387_028698, partial [Taxus chinensis]